MIYFIRSGEFVKIGVADDPWARFADLQTANAQALEMLAIQAGEEPEEGRLHLLFSAHHYRGEWFHAHPQILEYAQKERGEAPLTRRPAWERVSKFDLSEPDSVRLVVNTAVMAPPYHPDRYAEAIGAAAKAGYDVIVLDSMSHAWTGTGGMLDIVNEIARARYQNNSFAAWKDGTPIQNRLIEAILNADIHIIATMRSKTEYAMTTDNKGKSKPEKVGLAPIQRDGFEYEYDVIIDLGIDNVGVVNKTRCPALTGKIIDKPGEELAATLRDWLKGAPAEKVRRYGDGTPIGNKAGAIRAYDAYMELSDTPPANYDQLREWAEQQKQAEAA